MNTWNYRIIRYKDGTVGLHEVHYNAKGKLLYHTANPVICGGDIAELKRVLKMMLADIKRNKVLDESKIKFGQNINESLHLLRPSPGVIPSRRNQARPLVDEQLG